MKRILLMLFICISMQQVNAQMKEGTIVYQRKINLHRRITDEQFRAMVPEFRTSKHVLLFSDSTSIYKLLPEDEVPEPFEGGGTRTFVRMGGGSDAGELYKNFALGQSIMQTDLGAKTFIIQDSIKQQAWKLTDETKQINGFTCRKAIAKQKQLSAQTIRTVTSTSKEGGALKIDSATKKVDVNTAKPKEVDVVAWFAEGINSPVGPENNGGLPGVILQLDINNGETIYTALEIKKEVNKKEIKQPSKGKKVTRDEFNKLQMEALNNLQGGGGIRTMSFGN
jgi:GLPGLI family protein